MSLENNYRRSLPWNAKFWQRMGKPSDLEGMKCLDLGCGTGGLSQELVRFGAGEVVGLDIDTARIEFAKSKAANVMGSEAGKIRFVAQNLHELDEDNSYDYIFARDTFEHIQDLEAVLDKCHNLLKPGGKLYAGFGPLYNSPFGDHRLLGLKAPWAHLILFPSLMKRQLPFHAWKRAECEKVLDELNCFSFAKMQKTLKGSPFVELSFDVNKSTHPLMKLFNLARHIPFLRELFTVSIYIVYQRSIGN
jgi:SAM-dependent methyltransferase